MLDQDILKFFKARAAAPGAQPYQTQINQALREYVSANPPPVKEELLNDEGFISRLAERVAGYATGHEPRRARTPRTRTR